MIFVTGGTGLLGSHLMFELLNSGKKVKALVSPTGSKAQLINTFKHYSSDAEALCSSIQWVDAKLNNIYSLLDALEGVEEVYHCAGVVSFDPKDKTLLNEVNVEGTQNMVNAAIERGIRKFCHVSSIAAIGHNKDVINEETFWNFSPLNSTYAISKYNAEREVWRAAAEGLPVVIVNPSVIIGPGDWHNDSSGLLRNIFKDSRFYTEGVSGFVDVRDVAKVMVQLMESNISNERFIVSSENVSFKNITDLASACFGKRGPLIKIGKMTTGLAWRVEKIKSTLKGYRPLVTKETARATHQKSFYSNEKVKSALNFEFIPIEKSIQDTCKIFLAEKQNLNQV